MSQPVIKVKSKKQPTKKGANKIKRAGCRKEIIKRYYLTAYPRNKLRRILRSNGVAAAQSWADKHDCNGIFVEIRNQMEASV